MAFLFRKKKKKSDEEEPTNLGNARIFKHEELKKATRSFTTELASGSYGSVYLGTLRDGQMVAVKLLHNQNPNRQQEFDNEVTALSRLRHKNLVNLYGCTNPRGKELLLVYDYVPNSNVEDHLHGQRSDLTMAVRVQILMETAEALAYLHAVDPPVIHRDVTTSNIKLDRGFHVKVGGMGMCCTLPLATTQVSTVPRGTVGYRDPEYDRTSIVTLKSDVYSFGVIVVELISRKKAVDVSRAPDNIFLGSLALDKIIRGNLDDFIDPRLGYNSNIPLKRVINLLAELAGKCLHSTGIMRPTMKQALTELMQIDNELQQIGNVPLQEISDHTLLDDSLGKKSSDDEEPTNFGLARVFKHEELKMATNSFTTELGIGGFGSVYLGTLRDGQKVAVKLLHNNNPKRLKEFITEVMVLSNLRHDNLVTLHGCTNPRGKELLLVYEYVPNGTVEDHLHGQQSDLSMAVRLQIAVETAEALVYLHARVPPLIHRDLKTANIMLDHDFHVKVGDLGMSRLLPWDATQVTTMAQGTLGYRDPEYDRTLILTVKSDVYSFGVMVVELISGQISVDVRRFPDSVYLADLALEKISNNKLDDFVDPKLGYNSNVSVKSVIDALAKLACRCLHSTGTMRPTMEQVLTELKQLNVPLLELGDGSLTNGREATIEDPDKGASINNFSLLDDKKFLEDLLRASAEVLGKGKLRSTYRATLESGLTVVVKRFKDKEALSEEEFSQEMQLLQRVKHENLVEIIYYLSEKYERLIVYENIRGESLYKLLHDKRGAGEGPLNWAARLSIVKGMVRGLAYLHNAKILHANLKSSNVLVVQDNRSHPATYHAKLTDFGFLPFFQSVGQAQNLAIASTPELLQGKKPSQKADVYCFGLVLFEVITGKTPAVISTGLNDRSTLLDMLIVEDGHEEEMHMLIQIALNCAASYPDRRSSISDLVREMEEIREPDREGGLDQQCT